MKKNITALFLACSTLLFSQQLSDCSKCTEKLILSAQIEDLSEDEVRFLMNDLFARKGYRFNSLDIQDFYNAKSWYKPVKDNSSISFTDTEKKNIKLFQEKVQMIKEDHSNLIKSLERLKYLLKEGKTAELLSEFGIEANKKSFNDEGNSFQKLLTVLNRIDLNNINWFKKKAHYEVTVDSLNETVGYKIFIENSNVSLVYDYDTGSEKINTFLYPSDIFVEYTYQWKFLWKNGKLKMVDVVVAG